jgi:hypothetical protein
MVVLCIQYCHSFFVFVLFMFNFIVNFVSVIFSGFFFVFFFVFFLGGGLILVIFCLFAISISQAKIVLKCSIYKSYYVSEHKNKSDRCIYVICKRITVKVQCM